MWRKGSKLLKTNKFLPNSKKGKLYVENGEGETEGQGGDHYTTKLYIEKEQK